MDRPSSCGLYVGGEYERSGGTTEDRSSPRKPKNVRTSFSVANFTRSRICWPPPLLRLYSLCRTLLVKRRNRGKPPILRSPVLLLPLCLLFPLLFLPFTISLHSNEVMSWWWRSGPGPGTPQAESSLHDLVPQTSSSLPPASLGQTQVQQPTSIKVGILLDGDADYVSFPSGSLSSSGASQAKQNLSICQFTRAYTSKGRVGGESAAMELKNKVEHFIRKEKSVPPKVRIDMIAYSFL